MWRAFGRLAAAVIAWSLALPMELALAQVPLPVQEQVELFNSLPPSQQQAIIRELQQSVPPAQREAILNQFLRGGSAIDPGTNGQPVSPIEPVAPRFPLTTFEVPEVVTLAAGDTLVIDFRLAGDLGAPRPAEERLRLEAIQERLVGGNPYELDSIGQLYLPGVPAMRLAGLNIEQAVARIEAEPSLRAFDVEVTHLPLEPVGVKALRPFGYDFFSALPAMFTPADNLPVPADYIIGPGDSITIQLFGNQNQEYFLTVGRDGQINFPQIGPITVAGLTVTELRNIIDERVREQMIGVRASTTLGQLRSIQVFVLGDVKQPGSYTIGAQSTMTSALYASGGVQEIGSLRNIALMRNGQTITRLDLYDLLLRGDTSNDTRLQAGDVVFVPPVGATVAIGGEVRRPAVYEVRDEQQVSDLIALAGGLTPDANISAIKLERVITGRGTTVRDIDLTADAAADIRNGDFIRVEPNLPQIEESVALEGNVHRPGLYQWREGMTLSDLLPGPEFVKPMSDVNYVLIRRESRRRVDIEVLSADLEAVWAGGEPGAADLALQPRDVVYVFNLEVGRQHIIDPIIDELRTLAPTSRPLRTVTIDGQVRAPGRYPLEPGMRISDLLRAGGGLTSSAYAIEAELTRYEVVDGRYRETELLNIDLAAILRGDRAADVPLAPYDFLTIKEVPRWREQLSVIIHGEVTFPGRYSIRQGESLSSVLARAGGVTDLAFPEGSVFTRVELREREAEQLEVLARRIETDLASVALSDPSATEIISTGRTLVNQLREAEAAGRLVIDLPAIIAGDRSSDIVLRDGDELFIPPITQEVMVLGEVQYSTSHLYSARLSRDDYIDMSGGMTNRADASRIYIVRANGSVVAGSRGRWFSRSQGDEIRPGDTIVVPLDTDRVRPLVAWQGITQVLYNIAVAFSVIDRI